MATRSWLVAWWLWSSAELHIAQDGGSETSAVLEQLTVAMVGGIVDANLLDIRSSAAGKNLLRLGNTALPTGTGVTAEDGGWERRGEAACSTSSMKVDQESRHEGLGGIRE